MPYRIAVTPTFMTDLINSPKDIQRRFSEIKKDLENFPDQASGKKKKLKGCKYWRFRVAPPEYRIIYRVDHQKESVEILMMGPRKDDAIYKRINYIPEEGLSRIPLEVLPDVEPEYAVENSEIVGSAEKREEERDLPAISRDQLKEWYIESEHWGKILALNTEEELLNVNLPEYVKLRVIESLWPRKIEHVAIQPTYIINKTEELSKVADGKLSRLLINLDKEQLKAVNPSLKWPVIVKGGPGSGKTVVALYKIAKILDPDQPEIYPKGNTRILFTTFTNSLIKSSRELLKNVLGEKSSLVTVNTVAKMAKDVVGGNDRVADDKQKRYAMEGAISRSHSSDLKALAASLGTDYIIEEIEWIIEGWGLKDFEQYERQDRSGRRRGLNPAQRRLVWDLYCSYRDELGKKGLTTWERIQSEAIQRAQAWSFDYVFVDEVQDLKPVGLQFCVALCKDKTQVYLTADMNQSIYGGGGVSWKSVDNSLKFTRSTSMSLSRNYRCTDQILRASSDIIADLEDRDVDTLQTTAAHLGEKPRFVRLKSNREELTFIVEWIKKQLRDLSLPLSCVGIFCATNKYKDDLVQQLNMNSLPSMPFADGEEMDFPKVKVMTIHSSKGLEFPVVVIPNFRAEVYNWLGKGDSDTALAQAKRLFFVGCTRALRRLLVTCVGQKTDPLQDSLTESNWEIS